MPLIGKEANFQSKIRKSRAPELLKMAFRRYDWRNEGQGLIYQSLLKEFKIDEEEIYSNHISIQSNQYFDDLMICYDKISERIINSDGDVQGMLG